MPLFPIKKFFPLFEETTHPRECPFSLPRNSFYSPWYPLLKEHPFFSLRSSFSLGQPLLEECPFSPLGSAFHSLREPLPGECPFSPLKSSFHSLGDPFHGECPFSSGEPLPRESLPISLQMKSMFVKEPNMWVLLKVLHVSPRYLCLPILTWGD
jgi:hypothetical protein